MTVTRLNNQGWGFATMCFVCEDANPRGLRIPFFHDDQAGTVFADFTLDESFTGPPALVHGGILMTLCDEAMGWAMIVEAQTWALTAGNAHRFLRPVRVGRPHRVEARIDRRDEAGVHATATITSTTNGKVSVEAEAVFSPLSQAQAARAIGADVKSEH
ncbi:MAG TPA: PaaI family thioesterase, partial [Acidimicrobiales bacterium]|nr:PaaI family thioesterase [Acidimicrobiales bacterium]